VAFHLRVFGGLCLTRGGLPVHGAARQRRSLALLAVLAAHDDRGISREKLGALLWPEASSSQVRNRLKQAVYALRRDLGDQSVLGTTQLRLGRDAISCDLVDFRHELALGRLDSAVRLFDGPFLDGFHIGGHSEEFDLWVDAERRCLDRRAAEILWSLAESATRQGDHTAALVWCRRLASLDPLDGRYARAVATAELAVGNRAGALQHIALYERSLHRELELPVDADLQALAMCIRTTTDAWARPASREPRR
jgi:DNA-binding SARP family transcriptional activator